MVFRQMQARMNKKEGVHGSNCLKVDASEGTGAGRLWFAVVGFWPTAFFGLLLIHYKLNGKRIPRNVILILIFFMYYVLHLKKKGQMNIL